MIAALSIILAVTPGGRFAKSKGNRECQISCQMTAFLDLIGQVGLSGSNSERTLRDRCLVWTAQRRAAVLNEASC